MDAAALYLYAIDCAPLLYSALTHTVFATNVDKERVDDNKATGPLLANFSLYIYTTTKVLERGGGKKKASANCVTKFSTYPMSTP